MTAVVDGVEVAVGRREWVLQQVEASSAPAEAGAGAQQAADLSTNSGSSGNSSSSGTCSAGPVWGSGSDAAAVSEVWVGWRGRGLAGRLAFSDALRPDARSVVAGLQRQGLRVMLVSGDRPEVVQAVAAQAGIAAQDALAGGRPGRGVSVFLS